MAGGDAGWWHWAARELLADLGMPLSGEELERWLLMRVCDQYVADPAT